MSLDLSYEGLQRASERAAQLFTEIYCQLEERRVDPKVTREQMRSLFENTIKDEGIGLDRVLEEFEQNVLAEFDGNASSALFRTGQFVATTGRAAG